MCVLCHAEMLLCGWNVDGTVFPAGADGRNARMSRTESESNVNMSTHADSNSLTLHPDCSIAVLVLQTMSRSLVELIHDIVRLSRNPIHT